jgi:hypothetical protein
MERLKPESRTCPVPPMSFKEAISASHGQIPQDVRIRDDDKDNGSHNH